MARYIDADLLIETMQKRYDEICDTYGYHDLYASGYDDGVDAVENAPTADVAPKSEVAREIFEEIARKVASKIPMKFTPIFKSDLDYDAGVIDGKHDAFYEVLVLIAELKKKYTEGTANDGR